MARVIEWEVSQGLVPYPFAMDKMNGRVQAIKNDMAGDMIWCLEHASTYTAGTGANNEVAVETSNPNNIPAHIPPSPAPTAATNTAKVINTGRGGQITWHGPGQRVCYVMMDLAAWDLHAHQFVQYLLAWGQEALRLLDIQTFIPPDKDKIGLWVAAKASKDATGNVENHEAAANSKNKIADKICAIGVRLSPGASPAPAHNAAAKQIGEQASKQIRRKLVSSHGIAINLCPDLRAFDAIVPCGITDPRYGVTSIQQQGRDITFAQLDEALQLAWKSVMKSHVK